VPGTGQSHQGRGDIFRGLLIIIRHKNDLQIYLYHKSTYYSTAVYEYAALLLLFTMHE
jgi:hypothetical protein